MLPIILIAFAGGALANIGYDLLRKYATDRTPCSRCGMPRNQHRPLGCWWRKNGLEYRRTR